VNNWSKIGIIDTEQYSSSLYSHLGAFNIINLTAPFTPERYIAALHAFEQAGMQVVIMDSVTHVWSGEGGLLEYNTSLGGRFQDWAKTTPRYQKFIQGILQSPVHVITTIRKKESYALTTENGRTKVEKQGLDDEIRGGFNYELTVAFDINIHHLAEPSKDRTGLFMKTDGSSTGFVISQDTGTTLKQWSEGGVATPTVSPTPAVSIPTIAYVTEEQKKKMYALAPTLHHTKEEIETIVVNYFKLTDFENLTAKQADAFIGAMQQKIKQQEEKQKIQKAQEQVDVDAISAAIDQKTQQEDPFIEELEQEKARQAELGEEKPIKKSSKKSK